MSIVQRNLLIMAQSATSRNVTELSMSKNMATSNGEEVTSNRSPGGEIQTNSNAECVTVGIVVAPAGIGVCCWNLFWWLVMNIFLLTPPPQAQNRLLTEK